MGDDRSFDDHDHSSECNYQLSTKDQTQSEPRKTLNFNAPLLTTRRPANLKSINLSSCPNLHRRNNNAKNDHLYTIPFSWEKAPGKPKETPKPVSNDDEETLTPRPKLPPSLWRYRHVINHQNDVACNDDFDDENVYKDEDEIFSDAMEVFSLSEAIDIVERSQQISDDQSEGLRLKIIEDRSRSENQHEYPDFIIQRFLPDATALALNTSITLNNYNNNNCNIINDYNNKGCFDGMSGYNKESGQKTKTMSFSSLKGCGFKMLFRWSVKHRLCSVKNPVRRSDDYVLSGCNTFGDHTMRTEFVD